MRSVIDKLLKSEMESPADTEIKESEIAVGDDDVSKADDVNDGDNGDTGLQGKEDDGSRDNSVPDDVQDGARDGDGVGPEVLSTLSPVAAKT